MTNHANHKLSLPQRQSAPLPQSAPAAVPPSIEDRIREIRADIEAMIDARAEAMTKECPGVPAIVLRNLLVARAPGCLCSQILAIKQDE